MSVHESKPVSCCAQLLLQALGRTVGCIAGNSISLTLHATFRSSLKLQKCANSIFYWPEDTLTEKSPDIARDFAEKVPPSIYSLQS